MENLKKFNAVFFEALGLTENDLKGLSYQSHNNWDSVGHMALIAALEEQFDIMFDTDDIIDFSSYEKGKEILNKYGIEF